MFIGYDIEAVYPKEQTSEFAHKYGTSYSKLAYQDD